MDKLELVEIVREKAGVGYADAKEALDTCGDDLLDALVWLEVQGRSQTRSAYASTGVPTDGVSSEMRAAQSAYERSAASGRRAVAGWLSRARDACERRFRRGMESRVVSRRERGGFVTLPLLPTVIGEALWLLLSTLALQRGFYSYGLLIPLLQLAALLMPVVCFFYLVFACRIVRPDEGAEPHDSQRRVPAPAPAYATCPAGPMPARHPAPCEASTQAPAVTPSPEPAADAPSAPEEEGPAEDSGKGSAGESVDESGSVPDDVEDGTADDEGESRDD